jgi:ribosome-associated protein
MNKADALRLTKLAAKVADEKLGQEIVAIDVSKESSLADYFLFITGTSHVHIRALEDEIRDSLRTAGANLTRTDGQRGHLWRALDYGALIVHIMDQKTREFYSMEKLWERGRPVSWTADKAPAKSSAKAAAAKGARTRRKTASRKTGRR